MTRTFRRSVMMITCVACVLAAVFWMGAVPSAAADIAKNDYNLPYQTEKVSLPDIPIALCTDGKDASNSVWLKDPIRFEFYNTTTQKVEGIYTTTLGKYTISDGRSAETQMLSGVEMLRGNKYMVSVYDKDYKVLEYPVFDDGSKSSIFTNNYYISLDKSGEYPTNVKDDIAEPMLFVTKQETPLTHEGDGKRQHFDIPVFMTEDGTEDTIQSGIADAHIRLISPLETLDAISDDQGEIHVDLYEDTNYMVQLVDASGTLALPTFPLAVKDHSEIGGEKYIYNHVCCDAVRGLFVVDKKNEHAHDTRLRSLSGKTTVTGINFRNSKETDKNRYFISDRALGKDSVSGLSGQDYEVFFVEAHNMYRNEISPLAAGAYTYIRTIPSGRIVKNVYYVDDSGETVPVEFKVSNGKVQYTMDTLSMHPNVIVYDKAAEKRAALDKEWKGTYSSKIPAIKGVKAKGAKRKVRVTWKKLSSKQRKKFSKVEIQICKDKKFKRGSAIRKYAKKSKTSYTVTIKKKGTYYVRVRNVKGTGTSKKVSKWCAIKKVRVR